MSHAILLYEEGYKKVKIAKILKVSQRRVFGWFREYKEDGIASFKIKKGQGRKSILNEDSHLKVIKENINKYPNQPKKAYAMTIEAIGVSMHYNTFKTFLKKHLI